MALNLNPKIVTDGLVFAYDMGNREKSWKGKPTVNHISNPTEEMARGEFGQYRDLAPTFNTNGLVPHSLSMDIKANKPGGVYVYMQNGSYTKYGFVSSSVNVTTEYQRFYFDNITPSVSTPSETAAILATYTGYGSGITPTVKNIQLELGTFSTPFVVGARGITTTNYVDPSWSSWGIDGSGQGAIGSREIKTGYECLITDVSSNTRQSIYVTGISGSTAYTFSVKFKKISGAPTLRFQLQSYTDSTYLGSTFPTTVDLGLADIDGWQTAKWTYVTAAGANRVLWFMQDGNDYTTYTHTFSLAEAQVDLGYTVTDFYVGTRTLPVISDLTNNNTITPTNLTYNSDGSFSFANSTSVIDIPSTSLFNLTSVNFSIELWLYIDPSVDTSGVYHGLVEIGSSGSTFLLGIWRSGLYPGCLYNTFGGSTMFGTDGGGGYTGANYKLSGSWNHVVFTRNGATSYFYLNGNTWASLGTPSIPNTPNNLKIGYSPSAGNFPGKIPVFKFYNGRALTAAEVKQNFNALRGRYGI